MKNKKAIIRFLLLIMFISVLVADISAAAEIIANGVCEFRVQDCGNGSFQSSLATSPSAVSLTILAAGGPWQIRARSSDPALASQNIQLWVRRTNEGLGQGEVRGGHSYIPLGPKDTKILSGYGDIADINLQFKLTGITPQTPENAFSSEILFKVVTIP